MTRLSILLVRPMTMLTISVAGGRLSLRSGTVVRTVGGGVEIVVLVFAVVVTAVVGVAVATAVTGEVGGELTVVGMAGRILLGMRRSRKLLWVGSIEGTARH